MISLHEDFEPTLSSYWKRFVVGKGLLDLSGSTLRLINQDALASGYTNAQIDDYQRVPRHAFPWRPPLSLSVRARFSHGGPPLVRNGPMMKGTAGFGFWNDPFLMSEMRMPALPRAIWFFYSSPPSDMKLDLATPGFGWKAATIDACTWQFALLAPTAPIAVPLMNVRPLYRRLWPVGQRAIRVSEALVTVPMTDWHTYRIDWDTGSARFSVDGTLLLATRTPPGGPLGLVLWADNQFMVATPWGRFRYGYLSAAGRQWLELDWVSVETG